MFGPNFCSDRPCRLIAVAIRFNCGGRIIAQMRMDVDNARRHPFARAVNDGIAFGDDGIGRPDADDLAIFEQGNAIIKPPALAVIDRDIFDRGGVAGIGFVGRRIRIFVDRNSFFSRFGCGLSRSSFRRRDRIRTSSKRQRN